MCNEYFGHGNKSERDKERPSGGKGDNSDQNRGLYNTLSEIGRFRDDEGANNMIHSLLSAGINSEKIRDKYYKLRHKNEHLWVEKIPI